MRLLVDCRVSSSRAPVEHLCICVWSIVVHCGRQVLADIQAALSVEMESMTWGTPGSDPNGVPGQHGVCCSRAKACKCD